MILKLNLEIPENVAVPVKGKPGSFTKQMVMRHHDCSAQIHTGDNQKIGDFSGALGGKYVIEINDHEFIITPKMIYNAICSQFDLEPMQ